MVGLDGGGLYHCTHKDMGGIHFGLGSFLIVIMHGFRLYTSLVVSISTDLVRGFPSSKCMHA